MDRRCIKKIVCEWAASILSAELGNLAIENIVDESSGLSSKDERRVLIALEDLIAELKRRGRSDG